MMFKPEGFHKNSQSVMARYEENIFITVQGGKINHRMTNPG